ncbi:hypothetical protein L195_g028886 [Trifolium pratense]|uniref:Uncharacterized protein n=1 Tax=Trifolium pratense TaxID=57577 RepID=A0A2K3L368_TRIPR|nr:hypothetical protein L195_g028886 [Trifolium pratense]
MRETQGCLRGTQGCCIAPVTCVDSWRSTQQDLELAAWNAASPAWDASCSVYIMLVSFLQPLERESSTK